MTETLVQWFVTTLGGSAAKEVIVFLISMVPILELRGGLLAAGPAFLDIPILRAVPICIVGNVIPVPFILLLIRWIFKLMRKSKRLAKLVDRLENKAMSKKDQIEKYGFWGLVFFVGVPLPGTGAWTGSLIAALLGMKFKKAFPAVLLGIIIATVIMSVLSYGMLGAIFG
ncbi:MAG: small multi-drug export protein [Lachnospiraceae bacterium]|nr:small multi-drug export protein [Lachnospiraceae bacterium]